MKTWMSYSDRLRRHAPVADFAAVAPRYPVFRVIPEEGGEQ